MNSAVRRYVITAGPTREHLDPVRFLSNPSTGKMGFAIAAAAAELGRQVVLIAGPVALPTPPDVRRVDVVSARDMLAAAEREIAADGCETVFISTAAVADWRPAECAAAKLKKHEMSATLQLVRNPDILATLNEKRARGDLPVSLRLIGFAAETGDPTMEAARKCRAKGLELIVGNNVSEPGSGFGTDTNRVTIVRVDGSVTAFEQMSKVELGRRLIAEIEAV